MKIRPDTQLRALDTAHDSRDGMSAWVPPHRYWRSISFTHVPLTPVACITTSRAGGAATAPERVVR